MKPEKYLFKTYKEYACFRRELSVVEEEVLSVGLNIRLNIVLLLAQSSKGIEISSIYKSLKISNPAIRLNIRSLIKDGLIREQYNLEDKRTKKIYLTEYGLDKLTLLNDLIAKYCCKSL